MARPVVMDWLGLWRATPFVVQCDLPVEVAVARLNAAKAGPNYRYQAIRGRGSDSPLIRGKARADWVRLVAIRRVRNAWAPVFCGRFIRAQRGCRLEGSFAVRSVALIFNGIILAIAAVMAVLVLVAAARSMVVGAWATGLNTLLPLAAAIGIAAAQIVLIGLAGRSGKRDRQFLESWLNQVLTLHD